MSRNRSLSTAPDPERWSSRAPGEAAVEDRFGAAFRAVAAATELGPVPSGAARLHRLRRRRPGALAIAMVVLTAGSGAVWATHAWLRARPPGPELTRIQPPARARALRPLAPALTAPEPAAAPAVAPPPPVAAVTPPARRASVPAPPAPTPAAVPADPPPSETTLLARAFRALRTDRDPDAALAALDEHARRYPIGHLRTESELARVEALVMLGRLADALTTLEAWSPPPAAARRAALMRAELRAGLGHCRQGLTDFDQALAGPAADEIDERALRGRAACRERLGDLAGARADLALYLRRHPTAPFAAELRRQSAGVAP